jgi:hypothetical protein
MYLKIYLYKQLGYKKNGKKNKKIAPEKVQSGMLALTDILQQIHSYSTTPDLRFYFNSGDWEQFVRILLGFSSKIQFLGLAFPAHSTAFLVSSKPHPIVHMLCLSKSKKKKKT